MGFEVRIMAQGPGFWSSCRYPLLSCTLFPTLFTMCRDNEMIMALTLAAMLWWMDGWRMMQLASAYTMKNK
jgi:hypothetical protein